MNLLLHYYVPHLNIIRILFSETIGEIGTYTRSQAESYMMKYLQHVGENMGD